MIPGATRLALLGACPWLSYFAPSALPRQANSGCAFFVSLLHKKRAASPPLLNNEVRTTPGLGIQTLLNLIARLAQRGLHTRDVVDTIQQNKVMNHPVVSRRRYFNTGILQLARISLPFVS